MLLVKNDETTSSPAAGLPPGEDDSMNSPGDSGGAFGDGGLTLGDDLVPFAGFGDTFDVAEDFVARALLLEDFAFGDGTLGLGAAFLAAGFGDLSFLAIVFAGFFESKDEASLAASLVRLDFVMLLCSCGPRWLSRPTPRRCEPRARCERCRAARR